MQIAIKKNSIYLLTVFGMAVILFSVIAWGRSNGEKQEQSLFLVQTAQSLQQGLGYFFHDQGRFPTASEFSNRQIMSSYLTTTPLNIPSGSCTSSFKYQQLSASKYRLDFCLPASSGSFNSGWNTLTGGT